MHLFLRTAALGLLTLLHLQAMGQPSPVAEMDSLINSGDFQQAFDLGSENLEDWEGEPQFDFLYGLAALETGSANEAVFALERASTTANQAVLRNRSRLELARAYFVTNNLNASENLFNRVLETNPPANVQQNIQAFLQLIESRRVEQNPSFNWTVSSSAGSDGNINSATSNGLIDTPLVGLIELDEGGQQIDDAFMNTSLGLNYNYPITRDRAIDLDLNLNRLNNFSTDQFDIDSLRGSASYSWGDTNNRINHGVTATQVNLDGNGFQSQLGLNSGYQHNSGNGWYQTASASYTLIRFDTDNGGANADLRDVNQLLFTAGLTKLQGGFTHSGNLYYANESADNPNGGQHNGRRFAGFAYSLLYRLNNQHTPYLRLSYQDVEHDSEHPVFFNTVRADDTESMTLGWLWQFNRQFTLTAEAAYTDNTSNIELFDFTRFRYQAGFRYRF